MPIPFIIVGATIAMGVSGVGMGAKGGYDQNNNIYLVKIVASSNGSYKYSNLFDNSRNKEVFTITENGFTLNSYAKAIISVDKFIELNK